MLIFIVSHDAERMGMKVPSFCGGKSKHTLMIMYVHKEEEEKTSQSTLPTAVREGKLFR